jgi:hypothetical protein
MTSGRRGTTFAASILFTPAFQASLIAGPGVTETTAPRRTWVVDPALSRQALVELFPALGSSFVHQFPARIQATPEFVAGCGAGFVVAVFDEAGLPVRVSQHVATGFFQAFIHGFTSIEGAVLCRFPALGDALVVDVVLRQYREGESQAKERAHGGERHVGVPNHLHLASPFFSAEPCFGGLVAPTLRTLADSALMWVFFPRKGYCTWKKFPRQYGN